MRRTWPCDSSITVAMNPARIAKDPGIAVRLMHRRAAHTARRLLLWQLHERRAILNASVPRVSGGEVGPRPPTTTVGLDHDRRFGPRPSVRTTTVCLDHDRRFGPRPSVLDHDPSGGTVLELLKGAEAHKTEANQLMREAQRIETSLPSIAAPAQW